MTRIKLVTMLLLALIMATALGLSSDQTNNGAENERDAKVGGWQRLPVENVNAYKEVLTFLRNKEMVLHKGYRIFGVYRQIVAGVNYKFIVHMENEYRQIVVWKQLDGRLKLMSNEPTAKPEEL